MRKIIPLLFVSFLFSLVPQKGSSQILNAERFGHDFDSTKIFKGSINAAYSGARRKTIISSFRTGVDFSVKWKANELISSGSYSWLLSGKDQIRNEGFIHARYRIAPKGARIIPETFFQVQRDAILGMDKRLLAGQNIRFEIWEDSVGILFAGIGAFYETETWNFDGVPDPANVPANPESRETSFVKANLYISARREFTESFSAGAVVYVQARPDAFIRYPRIASDITLNFDITSKLGLRISFSSVYDRLPIVPIYNFYFNTSTGLNLSF